MAARQLVRAGTGRALRPGRRKPAVRRLARGRRDLPRQRRARRRARPPAALRAPRLSRRGRVRPGSLQLGSTGDDWRGPVEEAVAGKGCDVVILKYSDTEPEEYAPRVERSPRPARPRRVRSAVERWAAHYRELGIGSIAFGLVALRRRSDGPNWIRAIAAPGWPTERAGDHLERLFSGRDWELANRNGSASLQHPSRCPGDPAARPRDRSRAGQARREAERRLRSPPRRRLAARDG